MVEKGFDSIKLNIKLVSYLFLSSTNIKFLIVGKIDECPTSGQTFAKKCHTMDFSVFASR